MTKTRPTHIRRSKEHIFAIMNIDDPDTDVKPTMRFKSEAQYHVARKLFNSYMEDFHNNRGQSGMTFKALRTKTPILNSMFLGGLLRKRGIIYLLSYQGMNMYEMEFYLRHPSES